MGGFGDEGVMNRYYYLLLGICAVALLNFNTLIWADESNIQSTHSFEGVVSKKVGYRYLQFLPDSYDRDQSKEWPLILFLHGAGERGDDLQKVKVHGPPKIVESRPDFPFVVVSPQCPKGVVWDADALLAMLDEVIHRLRIDEKRVYVTGLSMGGYGTWNLIGKAPGRFAAAAPICGGGNTRDFLLPESKEALQTLPIWVFHGGKDGVVKPDESERLVELFQERVKGDIQLTIYPEAGHDSWTETYNNPKLYEWFLSHSR
jgi:predicted peptidase